MLAAFNDHRDPCANTRMWMTNELPHNIDEWPDGWRRRLDERQDALADSEEVASEDVLALSEEMVRREFRELPPMLEVA